MIPRLFNLPPFLPPPPTPLDCIVLYLWAVVSGRRAKRADSVNPSQGDVLAGAWQYMNEPWSSFREIDFDIIVDRGAWYYVGYGGFGKYEPIPPPSPPPPPEPSFSLCRDSTSGLNEIG